MTAAIGNNPFALGPQTSEQLPFESSNLPVSNTITPPTNPFNLNTNGIVDVAFMEPNSNSQLGENMNQQSPQGFGVQTPAFNPTPQAPAFGMNPAPQTPTFNQQPSQGFGVQNQTFNPAPQTPAFNQQTPQGFGMNNQFNNQNTNQNQQPKYVIIDFYWWINKKLMKGQPLANESGLLTVGYNSSFNNLRFTFYNPNEQTFTQSSIIIGNSQRITTCNIFAEQVLELFANRENGQTIRAYERVIKSGQSWTPNQTYLTWKPNSLVIQTQDSNGVNAMFECQDEQIIGLEKAFNFMIDGKAWTSSLYTTQNR